MSQTTYMVPLDDERYLGSEQDLKNAVNDALMFE
jgi:hypothetical protein